MFAVVWTVVLALVLFGTLAVLIGRVLRQDRAHSPEGIARHLQSQGSYYVELSGRYAQEDRTWDPSQPWPRNGIRGPGTGVYRLGDEGLVHLSWTPAGGQPEDDRVGPLLEVTVSPAPARHLLRAVVTTYIGASLVGFVLGVSLSSGTIAVRIGIGLAAMILAVVLAYLAMLYPVTRAARRARDNA